MPTSTGLRISSVDGTAFLDNCPADVLAAVGIGAQIKIYDSSSRYLQGVIDAVGSSEGLGSDILNGWNFTSGWSTYNTTIVDSNSFTGTDTSAWKTIAKTHSFSKGGLYLGTVSCTSSEGTIAVSDGNVSSAIWAKNSTNLYKSWTSSSGFFYIFTDRLVTNDVTTLTFQQVTAPSSSGVIIKDLSGNQNFISKDASFTYNAASYTYEIIQGGGCLVGSSALVGGHILVGHGSLIN